MDERPEDLEVHTGGLSEEEEGLIPLWQDRAPGPDWNEDAVLILTKNPMPPVPTERPRPKLTLHVSESKKTAPKIASSSSEPLPRRPRYPLLIYESGRPLRIAHQVLAHQMWVYEGLDHWAKKRGPNGDVVRRLQEANLCSVDHKWIRAALRRLNGEKPSKEFLRRAEKCRKAKQRFGKEWKTKIDEMDQEDKD